MQSTHSISPISIYTYLLALVLLLLHSPLQAEKPAIKWTEPINVASGDAHVGPWRMNESTFHYVDDSTVAINNHGSIGVAWANQTRQDIFFQRYNSEGQAQLAQPINVSQNSEIFSWLPRMVITNDDPAHVYILWQEIVFSGGTHGGEAFFARSTDGGKTFSEPINLSNSLAGDGKGRLSKHYWHNGSLDLVMAPSGNLYAAWTEYEGRLWVSRSTDEGKSFSTPVHVAGNNQTPARGPSLAVAPDGTFYLAWTVGEDPAANIHFAKSNDQGRTFTEPRILEERDGHTDAPKLAVDNNGTIHLVYGESPSGPLQQYHIRYSHSEDSGDSFARSDEISMPHSRQYHSVNFPHLGLDGEDNLYVIWELFPESLKRHGRSRGLGFTYSTNSDHIFVRPSVIPGTTDLELGVNGSLQGLLMRKLAVNKNGAVAVVNSTFDNNDASHIWLIRGQRMNQ